MTKMFKFSIKIDDDDHTLSAQNGIPFESIAELLKNLFEAIDPHTGAKCTLGQIRGNCYALDFYSVDEKYHSNFVIVHKNIEQIPLEELDPAQKEYARCLKRVLGGKYFVTAFDNDKKEVASIKKIDNNPSVNSYYATQTVYGIVSQLGGPSLDTEKKHIYLDGVSYRIAITKDQDIKLKAFYGTSKLRVKVRVKMSALDGHIFSGEMISFTKVGDGNFMDNLAQSEYIDLPLIRDAESIDEIVKRIYNGIN